MHITPILADFACDTDRHVRIAQTRREPIEAWRASAHGQRAEALVAAACAAEGAEAVRILRPLFESVEWAKALIANLTAALAHEPFYLPPMRDMRAEMVDGLALVDTPRLTLSLAVMDADAFAAYRRKQEDAPQLVGFAPGHVAIAFVKTGGIALERFTVAGDGDNAALANEGIWRPETGDILIQDHGRQAFRFTALETDCVMLRAYVRDGESANGARAHMREFDVITGQLVHLSTGADVTARTKMMLSLLRTMDRRDAAPHYIEALSNSVFDVRWHAMREFLALDVEAALPHLDAMAAADPHPQVRRAAASTVALLCASHPEIAEARRVLCPA